MESETSSKPLSLVAKAAHGLQSVFRERTLFIIAIVLGVFFVACTSFAFGFFAGVHKANFSNRFGENYERNFVKTDRQDMKDRMLRKMDGKLFRSGHGVSGEVLSIVDRTIVVRNQEDQENSITVTDLTVYHKGGDRVDLEAVSVGDRIVVLGKPGDDGTVNADLIRVLGSQSDRSEGFGRWFSR